LVVTPALFSRYTCRYKQTNNTWRPRPIGLSPVLRSDMNTYKKLSYCWETVRRESMPRIAEMDVEMTT